jgi:hypothetical protein
MTRLGDATVIAAGETAYSSASESTLDLGSPYDFTIIASMSVSLPGAQVNLFGKGTNYQTDVDAAGLLHWNGVDQIGSVTAGEYRHYAWVMSSTAASPNYKLFFYRGEHGRTLQLIDSGTVTTPPSTNSTALTLGQTTTGPGISILRLDLLTEALTIAELQAIVDGYFAEPSSISMYTDGWKFDDGTGTTAASAVSGADLTVPGTWIEGPEESTEVAFDDAALLLFRNFARDSEGASATATSEAASGRLGAEWLTSDRVDRVWQSATLSSEGDWIRVVLNLGQSRLCDTFGFFGSNLADPGPKWRVRAFSALPPDLSTLDAGADSEVHRSGWRTAIMRASLVDYPDPDAFDPSLGPPPEDIVQWAADGQLHNLAHFVPAACRYWFLEFDLTEAEQNGAYDYIEILELYVALAWQPTQGGLEPGWQFTAADPTEIRRADGGIFYGAQKPVHREVDVSFTHIEGADSDPLLYAWLREGKTAHAFFWADPTDRSTFYERSVFGFTKQLSPIARTRLALPDDLGFTIAGI